MHSERYYRGPARSFKLGLNKRGEVKVLFTPPVNTGTSLPMLRQIQLWTYRGEWGFCDPLLLPG